jgi:iron complex transport system permease protein
LSLELVEARRRRWKLYVALLAVAFIFFVIFLSVCVGSSTIPFEEGLKVLFKWLPLRVDVDEVYEQIILAIRLPRVLMGCVVGASLSLAGAILRGFSGTRWQTPT